MMQPGVRAFYPQQAYELKFSKYALQILTTRKVRHRGDTLDGPTLDVRLSSLLNDVIRVQIGHFLGG